jgi:hypothetical protein
MIIYTKEPYPGAESAHLNLDHLSIERHGGVISSLRAIGSSIRDSWLDLSDDHLHVTQGGQSWIVNLFVGIFEWN